MGYIPWGSKESDTLISWTTCDFFHGKKSEIGTCIWLPALSGHIPLSWFLSHLIQKNEQSAEPSPLEHQTTKGKTFSYNQCCSMRLEKAHDWGFCLHKRCVKRALSPAFQSGSGLCLASYWLLRNLQSLGLGAAWDKGKWMSILLELALIFKIVKSCRMKIYIFKCMDTK